MTGKKIEREALYDYLMTTWVVNKVRQRQYHEMLDLARKHAPEAEIEELYSRHYAEIDKYWAEANDGA